jgi:hypothetical protein
MFSCYGWRSPGKSLKTLSAPVPGGVASEVTLQNSPRGRGYEHFPGCLGWRREVIFRTVSNIVYFVSVTRKEVVF